MSTEPCGSLPVTSLDLMISYCHHHMAWFAMIAYNHQSAGDNITTIGRDEMSFGPFDAWEDVAAWVAEKTSDPSEVPPA